MYERAAVESRSILPAILGWMADAQLMASRFAEACDLTREAVERTEETGGTGGLPWEVGLHAVALARLGRLDDAEATAREVVEGGAALGLDAAPARLALAVAAASRGDGEAAVAHFRALDLLKRGAGIREPRLCAHAGEYVEALLGTGRQDEAADVAAVLEEEAEISGGRWSLAVAARCRGLLLAAGGDLEGALDEAERSVALFEGLPMPFERARTLLLVGQLRRRRREKRPARDALTDALEIFEHVGTPIWAERVRTELARIPDHQAPGGLTPTEERVARLAAEGLTNQEIAERAFLSLKTVEVNLTRVYRKLGVRRAALAQRLAEAGAGAVTEGAGPST
jgi:DNA-binding CsgD family transcriptional regulator